MPSVFDGLKMPLHDRYPNIAKACFLIAIDNGGINRDRSESRWRKDFRQWVAGRPEPLIEIDRWIGARSETELETLCCGEHSEIETLVADAPVFINSLLNDYFDEVC